MSTTSRHFAPCWAVLEGGRDLPGYHRAVREQRRASAADHLCFVSVLQLEGPRLLHTARRCMDLAADLLAASTRVGWDHSWRVFRFWAREVDRLERRDARERRRAELRLTVASGACEVSRG